MTRPVQTNLSRHIHIFSGGLALDAVYFSKTISGHQKSLLLYLGACANFKGDFVEWNYHSLEIMSEHIGFSKSTTLRAAKELEEKGYLVREKRYNVKDNKRAPSNYRLTDKIFDEYETYLVNVRKTKEVLNVPQTLTGGPKCPTDTLLSVPQTLDLFKKNYLFKDNTIVAPADASTTPPVAERKKQQKADTELWKIWKAAYEEKKQSSPSTSAKRYKMCSDLTVKWGKEAQEVMKFYLHSRDEWHLKQEHSLECALSQCEKILDNYNFAKNRAKKVNKIDKPIAEELGVRTEEERIRMLRHLANMKNP